MSHKDPLCACERPVATRSSLDIAEFLEGSVLRRSSSVELGWRHIAIERRTVVPCELPATLIKQHFLILWDTHVAEGESAYRGGRFSPYRKYPNTMTTCHPGLRPATRNRSDHEAIVACLGADLFDGIQDELDERPTESLRGLYGADDPEIRSLILLLTRESDAGGPSGTLYVDSLATALATRLIYATRLRKPPMKTVAGILPDRVLRRVVERMQLDLSNDLDLQTLVAESGYSRGHFLRTFKAATGQTPHRYLLELRLQRARELVVRESMPLIDVAAACGLSSHGHLATAFRSRFGVSPSQYRRSYRS